MAKPDGSDKKKPFLVNTDEVNMNDFISEIYHPDYIIVIDVCLTWKTSSDK